MKVFIWGKWYNLTSKREILEDFFQDIIKGSYFKKKKIGSSDAEFIKCGCHIRLYTARTQSGLLTLKSYPNLSERHRSSCIFNKFNVDNAFDYESSEHIKVKSDKVFVNFRYESFEKFKFFLNAFEHLSVVMLENAYSSVFNKTNLNLDRLKDSKKIKQPKIDDVTQFLKNDILETETERYKVKYLLEKLNYEIFVIVSTLVEINQDVAVFKTNKGSVFTVPTKIIYSYLKAVNKSLLLECQNSFLMVVLRDKANKRYIRIFMQGSVIKDDTLSFYDTKEEKTVIENQDCVFYKGLLPTSLPKILTKKYSNFYFETTKNIHASLISFSDNILLYNKSGEIVGMLSEKENT